MAIDKKELDQSVDDLRAELSDLALRIHRNPELRFQEHSASRWLSELVRSRAGIEPESKTGGLETAFRARAGGAEGPRVAVLAEYDALPEIGHACGHNLIGVAAVGAFIALAKQAERLAGRVELIGTPAEEGGGGKITLAEAGVFDGIDAAMMFHPFDRDLLSHPALASTWIEMRFGGVPSHAAMAPHEGKSALSACMNTFHLVDSQRLHFGDGVRVHGYVVDGGQAVNVVVERAACEFSVRAPTSRELERVKAIVERCARAAAMASDVSVEMSTRQGYKDMRNNMTLARRFGQNLSELGRVARESDPRVGAGSTDMGDLSHRLPAIHPYLAICDEGVSLCHQHSFASFAAAERALDTMLVAAKAMARTTADLLEDRELLASVQSEFKTSA